MLGWLRGKDSNSGNGVPHHREEDAAEKLQAPMIEEHFRISSDSRHVIDILRRDIASQRTMLDSLHSKLDPMIQSVENLKAERDPIYLRANFVSSARFAEAIAELRLELSMCKTMVSSNPTPSGANGIIRLEDVDRASERAVAKSMQDGMTALRQEISRGYVGKDEFSTALKIVREVASLHEAPWKVASGRETALASLEKSVPIQFPALPSASHQTLPSNIASQRHSRSEDSEIQVVLLHQTGSRLGVMLDGSDGESLAIDKIADDGLIHAWNATYPSRALKPGDHIVAVNGVRGDSNLLMDAIASSSHTDVVLKVSRRITKKVIHLDEASPLS